jgi:hypothetical protein
MRRLMRERLLSLTPLSMLVMAEHEYRMRVVQYGLNAS